LKSLGITLLVFEGDELRKHIVIKLLGFFAAGVLLSSCATQEVQSKPTGSVSARGEYSKPATPENSDHGYFLEDDRIPRLYSCEEWKNFWDQGGPAVSFDAAKQFPAENLAVSTQIYWKNKNLDSDRDGVICFYENEAKPNPLENADVYESASLSSSEPWVVAVQSVRSGLESQSPRDYPLDFAASPNSVTSHASIVKKGVSAALRYWSPFINSNRPLAMTVVNPADKSWFLRRWEQLGKDNTGEFWWNLAKSGGGGAVGVTNEGIPNMYFMASSSYPPPDGAIDYYVHEVAHFFQSVTIGIKNESKAPCWYFEGTASFIGFAMSYPNDLVRTVDELRTIRSDKAKVLYDFYTQNKIFTAKRIERDLLNFPQGDPSCQHESPQFGYNLGYFVSEKLVIDFGFQAFIDLTLKMKDMSLDEAFEAATRANYRTWIQKSVVDYSLENIKKLGSAR
jgi:hypothetical protein